MNPFHRRAIIGNTTQAGEPTALPYSGLANGVEGTEYTFAQTRKEVLEDANCAAPQSYAFAPLELVSDEI